MVTFDGVDLPDRRRMKSVEEDGYKYWGILEYNEVLHAEMKISLKNKYHGSDYGSEHLGCISLTMWGWCDQLY